MMCDLIDVEAYLNTFSAEQLCGVNLEFDAQFLELENEMRGKTEVQFGDLIRPAVLPDWKIIKQTSLQLLERSIDLRIALYLTRALLNLDGVQRIRSRDFLILKILETKWDSLHPQLEAEDGFDPMLRINILSSLCECSTILHDFRVTCLINSPVYGRFNLRDIELITNESENLNQKESAHLLELYAAFNDTEPNLNVTTLHVLQALMNSCQMIEQILTEKVGVRQAIDFSPLLQQIQRTCDFFETRVALQSCDPNENKSQSKFQNTSQNESQSVPEFESQMVLNPQTAKLGFLQSQFIDESAAVNSVLNRHDVLRLMMKINEYYAKFEPSSPVPLILLRAQKLVDKNFVEIIRDLAPDGLAQVYLITGLQDGH